MVARPAPVQEALPLPPNFFSAFFYANRRKPLLLPDFIPA